MILLIFIYKQMEEILERLQKNENWKQAMRLACRHNGLNTSLAGDLTILKLKNLDERFKKSYATNGTKITSSWIENQLRSFNWLLIALSAIQKTKISDFNNEQWAIMKKIFSAKDTNFLKFEARKFIEEKNKKNKNWTQQQEQLLREQMQKVESSKICWNEVAHKIFQRSNEKYFRNGKHCREHWFNYLDPSKQRGAWATSQDIYLFDMVANNGKKWSQYAITLKRTQHTVKNRYNSIVIKQKKLTPHIKNEQKLLKEIRQRLCHSSKQSKVQQSKKSISIEQSQISQQQKDSQIKQQVVNVEQIRAQVYILEDEVKVQAKQQKEIVNNVENLQVQNPLSNYSPALVPQCDLNFYIKQDNQIKKNIFSEFPIYSPYSPYIISPNTPNNYLSPQPVFINSQFYAYYNAFITDLKQEPHRQNKSE